MTNLTIIEKRPEEWRIRTARKPHACQGPRRYPDGTIANHWDGSPIPPGHTGAIAAGQLYVESVTDAAPYSAGRRYCAHCAIAAGIVAEVAP